MYNFKSIGLGLGLSAFAATLLLPSSVSAKTNTITNTVTNNVVYDARYNWEEKRESCEEVNGIDYKLTIDQSEATGYLEEKQLDHIEALFYEAYPKMYDRFGGYNNAPTDVIIKIVPEVDEDNPNVISTSGYDGNVIWLKEKWLDHAYNYDGFDALTYEFGQIIQYGWDYDNLEFGTDSCASFAEYCRFIYAYKDGRYNDKNSELEDANTESERDISARFLVWLDYETSESNKDIIRDYFEVCSDFNHSSWDKEWKTLFKNTKFSGKSIDEVWDIYVNSDFAYYDSVAPDKDTKSELINETNVREYIKNHSFSERYESTLK